MVMRKVMQDGIGRFLDALQNLRANQTPYGCRTLLKDVRKLLERGAGVATLLPFLARYHVRCFGKLVNEQGDYTCMKDLVIAFADVHRRGRFFFDDRAIADMFEVPGEIDDGSTCDQRWLFAVIFRQLEDRKSVPECLQLLKTVLTTERKEVCVEKKSTSVRAKWGAVKGALKLKHM